MDKKQDKENLMYKSRTLAINLNLEMKISDVEYQGDLSKATFYYTAEGRVDFRQLIKDMASEFRIRIEMKQIGARQESARLGGIGSCGSGNYAVRLGFQTLEVFRHLPHVTNNCHLIHKN